MRRLTSDGAIFDWPESVVEKISKVNFAGAKTTEDKCPSPQGSKHRWRQTSRGGSKLLRGAAADLRMTTHNGTPPPPPTHTPTTACRQTVALAPRRLTPREPTVPRALTTSGCADGHGCGATMTRFQLQSVPPSPVPPPTTSCAVISHTFMGGGPQSNVPWECQNATQRSPGAM